MTINYKTEIVGTVDGKGYIGMAMWLDRNVWRMVGETMTYRTYPAAVRARSAAEALVRLHKAKHFPLMSLTITKQ